MPEIRHNRPGKQKQPSWALPLLTSVSILCAALLTGALVCVWLGGIGWPFFLAFVLASLIGASVCERRGLFIFVTSIPILFAISLIASAWFIVRDSAADGAPVSKTQIITAIYPLAQYFPILFFVTLAAGVIAVIRIKVLGSAVEKKAGKELSEQRKREREADRRNRRATSRARNQSKASQVTVEELMQKRRPRPHGGEKQAQQPAETHKQPQRAQTHHQPQHDQQRRPQTPRAGYPDPGAMRIRPEEDPRVLREQRGERFQHEVEHGPRRPVYESGNRRERASRNYSQRPNPELRHQERFEDRFARTSRAEQPRQGERPRQGEHLRQGEQPRDPRYVQRPNQRWEQRGNQRGDQRPGQGSEQRPDFRSDQRWAERQQGRFAQEYRRGERRPADRVRPEDRGERPAPRRQRDFESTSYPRRDQGQRLEQQPPRRPRPEPRQQQRPYPRKQDERPMPRQPRPRPRGYEDER
ncbi:DUF6542 domain-containing protein [Corynebacterium pseudopelargi]|uniref:DUF6542 domain-containing protein n=1 Tax=Corynebacterium pseudopelargi TaxID=2080757 RepID=A0A3G6IVC8_9CORY|nr:hypothetical protein CPPEL_07380 [Corynebacterium pseudopelargi]